MSKNMQTIDLESEVILCLSKQDKSEQVFYERIFRYAALKYSLIQKDYLRFCLA